MRRQQRGMPPTRRQNAPRTAARTGGGRPGRGRSASGNAPLHAGRRVGDGSHMPVRRLRPGSRPGSRRGHVRLCFVQPRRRQGGVPETGVDAAGRHAYANVLMPAALPLGPAAPWLPNARRAGRFRRVVTDIKNIKHPALSVMESAMRTLWPVLRQALYDPIERPACFQPSGQPWTVQGLEQPLPAKALSLAASVPAAGVLPDSVVKVAYPCPSPLWIPKVTS
jgi:hypothetical protein